MATREQGPHKSAEAVAGRLAAEVVSEAVTSRRLAATITSPSQHFCAASTELVCRLRLEGSNFAPSDRLALVEADDACGTDSVVTGVFASDEASPDGDLSSATVAVFSLGAKSDATAVAYRVCVCSTGGTCSTANAADWGLDAGVLSAVAASTGAISVYAGLGFDLVVDCQGCDGGPASRYKLVDDDEANDADAWDSLAGCGMASQSARHVLPVNCETEALCGQTPASVADGQITWSGLLTAPRWLNEQQVPTTYDVCFCNSGCTRLSSWFKAGEIQVKPVAVLGPHTANTPDIVRLLGSQTEWGTDGETKLLAWEGGHGVGDPDDKHCFITSQSSDLVLGHTCTTPVDCAAPTISSIGISYDSVSIVAPGWAAVCYCDESCTSRKHWFALGHIAVAGPAGGQAWTLFASMRSSLDLSGWHLSTSNRIRIIAVEDDCTAQTSVESDSSVDGPSPSAPAQLQGDVGSITGLSEIPATGGAASATRVDFASEHGLSAGMRVTIAGVTCGSSCAETTTEELSMFNRDHVVASVLGDSAVSIAVGFDAGAHPDTDTAAATWRRSDLQTYSDVRVSSAGRYRVCWRAQSDSVPSLSSEAGSLLITAPLLMSANLYLTATEPGRTAPVVLAFTTSGNQRYVEALEAMRLKVSFVRPEFLAPALRDGAALAADADRDELEEASQSACGKVLLELHSDDSLGFPMPDGCYLNQDEGVWDFYLVFGKENGLKPSTEYQMVFNAQVLTGLTTAEEVVEVWSMDDIVHKRYDVLEVGRAKPNVPVATSLREASDPAFDDTEGVKVVAGDDPEMLTLEGLSAFRVQVTATADTPILGGNYFRLFMHPLLQWNIGGACEATCVSHEGTTCGNIYCDTDSVTGDIWQRNVMKFVFPQGMADITDVVRPSIDFSALSLPVGGFFPTRLAADLHKTELDKPHYVATSGLLMYVVPTLKASLLVDSLGVGAAGDALPFKGDSGNSLYAKVVLGTTLYAAASADASLTIFAPEGYACVGVSDVPAGSEAFAGQVPSGRGSLAQGGGEHGTWTASGAECSYDLAASQAIFGGSSVYLSVEVDNPEGPLPEDAAGNLWRARLGAKGAHSSKLTSPEEDFKEFSASSSSSPANGEVRLAASTSVLGKLTEVVVVPSNFAQGAEDNWLQVFFRAEQAVSTGGALVVEAPWAFSFGSRCQLRDLPKYQHSDFVAGVVDVGENPLLRLRLPFSEGGCVGSMSAASAPGYDRARITLSAPLDAGGRYGFCLRVANPRYFHAQQPDAWRLSTRSPGDLRLDAALHSARLNGEDTDGPSLSWVVHEYSFSSPRFGVAIQDLRPTGVAVTISVFPIVLRAPAAGPLRVLAPVGYVWDFEAADFVHRKRAAGLTDGQYVPGAQADLPLAAAPAKPSASPFNVLEVADASAEFRPRTKYGFIAKIVVPDNTPVASANEFVIMVGQEDAAAGAVPAQAGTAAAPRIRRITSASAWLAGGAVASADSILALRFETLTDVPAGGGLLISGPPGFTATASDATCELRSAAATGGVAAAPGCECTLASGANGLQISVEVDGAILPGFWELHMPLVNPSEATAAADEPAAWVIESHELMGAAAPEILDYAGTAPGVRIGAALATADIVTGAFCTKELVAECAAQDRQYQRSGRNDRFGEQNNLVFEIGPSGDVDGGRLSIRAPEGFEWAAECNVTIGAEEVFGPYSTLPEGFSPWPANTTLSSCRGRGPVAFFDISGGGGNPALVGGQRYLFRVDSVRNPSFKPTENAWLLSVAGEASAPVAGFPFWSLGNLAAVVPEEASRGAAQSVVLRIEPLHEVPVQGVVVVRVPPGFAVDSDCGGDDAAVLQEESVCDAPWPECFAVASASSITDDPEAVEADRTFNLLPGVLPISCRASDGEAVFHLTAQPLVNGTSYVLRLPVRNPAIASNAPASWHVKTMRHLWWVHSAGGGSTYETLDASELEGFRILAQVSVFTMDSPILPNGEAPVSWQFTASFDEALLAKDTVTFSAPSGFDLEALDVAPGACADHEALTPGLLPASADACTSSTPCYYDSVCSANVMAWSLQRCPAFAPAPGLAASEGLGLCVQRFALLRFALASQNPEFSPAWNRFTIRHSSLDGGARSSGSLDGYRIYPVFGAFAAELNMTDANGRLFEAVGSESSVRLAFTVPQSVGSEYLVIRGAVGGESFKFNGATAYDDHLGTTLPALFRQNDMLILKRKLEEPGEAVSITLRPLQNPAVHGVTSWNISAYKYWNVVQGLRYVVSEILEAPGFRLLGYVAVQGVGSLTTLRDATEPCLVVPCAAYYGRSALATLAFRSSVSTPAGGEVLVRAPPNYAFLREDPDPDEDSAIRVRLGGRLWSSVALITGGNIFSGRWELFDASAILNSSAPVYKQAGVTRFLFWQNGLRRWIISFSPGSDPLGIIGEARSPSDALGYADPAPAVPHQGWSIGAQDRVWTAATELRVFGEGSLSADRTQLTLTTPVEHVASALGSISVTLQLPTLDVVADAAAAGPDDVEKKWLLETSDPRADESERRLATNDELFSGFSLVAQIAFTVVPLLRAPSVRSELSVSFDQVVRLFSVGVPNPSTVRYDLKAPLGFSFPSSCFAPSELTNENRLFDSCSGLTQTASLASSRPAQLKGTKDELKVQLVVLMPVSTPVSNRWTLQYYLQGSSQRSGYGEAGGFEVSPMVATLFGDSRLGRLGYSFLTFVPTSRVPSGWKVRMEPPASQGYEVSCIALIRGTLPRTSICTQMVDGTVKIELPEGSELASGVQQTFGLRVKNPDQLVLSHVNLWKVLVLDDQDSIQDTNFEVTGVSLGTSYISVPEQISVSAVVMGGGDEGRVTVSVPVVVGRDLRAGLVTRLRISPPEGFSLLANTTPTALPLESYTLTAKSASYEFSNATVVPSGQHVLTLSGTMSATASARGSGGGLWRFQAFRDEDVYFTQGMSGFSG